MNLKRNALYIVAAASISLLAGSAWAQDAKGGASSLLSTADGNVSVQDVTASPVPQGVTPACVSFQDLASWDLQGDSDNIVIDINIGAGNALTGVGFDLGIATVGPSWLNEAVILHTNTAGMPGIELTPGVTAPNPGDMEFSSNGIIDFSDNMLPDIVAGADGILRLELFEVLDDFPDGIDANYRNAANPAVCPGLALVCSDQDACNAAVAPEPMIPVSVNNIWALGTLVLLLALLGFVAIRRIA